ncbi:formate-dependent phosphoribosylglycinamide formyltransferase [Bifidobacterium gallicum]|nr:formate-dependent phosphoribosylglycinamide formyltransferase [Bifidobacterium gallicum]
MTDTTHEAMDAIANPETPITPAATATDQPTSPLVATTAVDITADAVEPAPSSSATTSRTVGTPLGQHPTRVLLLGSGELGKEVAIALQRLGVYVVAADSYAGAPAQQVAHAAKVVDMADAQQLQDLITEVKPNIIVPEVEAIATQELTAAAQHGIQVVPSAKVAQICMDREQLRTLAAETLGLPTTPYRFAGSLEELRAGAEQIGYPCVVKPVMSSSGHGQSVVRSADQIDAAWKEAQEGRRAASEGDTSRVIVEQLVDLDAELTMLTVASSAGIVTCEPIGQRQEDGDYRESWQPADTGMRELEEARRIATAAVQGLVDVSTQNNEHGWGVYGVELFVLKDGTVLFNEVSPRPHDTGMVTMMSQRLNEFELHARAILGLPITADHVTLALPKHTAAASHAIVVEGDGEVEFGNLDVALAHAGTDLRVFAKPVVHGHRRMGVALAAGTDPLEARVKASQVAQELAITVVPANN